MLPISRLPMFCWLISASLTHTHTSILTHRINMFICLHKCKICFKSLFNTGVSVLTCHSFSYQHLTLVEISKVLILVGYLVLIRWALIGTVTGMHALTKRIEQTILPSQIVQSTRQGIKNVTVTLFQCICYILYHLARCFERNGSFRTSCCT